MPRLAGERPHALEPKRHPEVGIYAPVGGEIVPCCSDQRVKKEGLGHRMPGAIMEGSSRLTGAHGGVEKARTGVVPPLRNCPLTTFHAPGFSAFAKVGVLAVEKKDASDPARYLERGGIQTILIWGVG